MKKGRKLVALMLAMVMLLMLAACSGTEKTEEKAAQTEQTASAETTQSAEEAAQNTDAEEIRIAIQTSGHSTPVYYGETQGMFEKVGLKPEILTFSNGPAQNEAAGANEWDIACTGGLPACLGSLAYEYQIIAYAHTDCKPIQIWCRDDSIKAGEADTWRGKSILCNTGASTQFGMDAILATMGLTEDDVTVVHMDVPSALTAYKAGEGDAVVLWDPQNYEAEELGWNVVGCLADTDEILPTIVVASKQFVENHPEAIVKFLEVYMEAQTELMADQELYTKTYFDFQEWCSISTTMELAERFCADRPYPSIEEQVDYFSGEANQTKMDDVMKGVCDFQVKVGNLEEGDWDILQSHHFVNGTFILQAAENLLNGSSAVAK